MEIIYENFFMIINQLYKVIYSPFNRLLILSCSAQVASMIAKAIINSIKAKSISFKNMANYGGMPSSHTVFITSFVFGVVFDKDYGWQHPFFVLSLIFSAIILTDAVRLRGTVDQLNAILRRVVQYNEELKNEVKFPKFIAHKTSEVIGGLIFAFLYTLLFYIFFYGAFSRLHDLIP